MYVYIDTCTRILRYKRYMLFLYVYRTAVSHVHFYHFFLSLSLEFRTKMIVAIIIALFWSSFFSFLFVFGLALIAIANRHSRRLHIYTQSVPAPKVENANYRPSDYSTKQQVDIESRDLQPQDPKGNQLQQEK